MRKGQLVYLESQPDNIAVVMKIEIGIATVNFGTTSKPVIRELGLKWLRKSELTQIDIDAKVYLFRERIHKSIKINPIFTVNEINMINEGLECLLNSASLVKRDIIQELALKCNDLEAKD